MDVGKPALLLAYVTSQWQAQLYVSRFTFHLAKRYIVARTITHQNSQPSIQAIVSDTFFPSHVERGPSNSLHLSLAEWPRLPCTAQSNERHVPSRFVRYLSRGWGLMDLPLRASNEGSPRPRVARAQKIISPHPLPLLFRRFLCLSRPLLS